MTGESPQSAQPARPIRRVSMIPHHSSYPRAPYGVQKNVSRTSRPPVSGDGTAIDGAEADQVGNSATGASSKRRNQAGAGPRDVPTPGETSTPRGTPASPTSVREERQTPQTPSERRIKSRSRQNVQATEHAQRPKADASASSAMRTPYPPSVTQFDPAYSPPQLPSTEPGGTSQLPPGAVLAPGMPPFPQEARAAQRPRRTPKPAPLDGESKGKKVGNTVVMIVLIVFFFTSVLPRIVDALTPDESESLFDITTEEVIEDPNTDNKSIADPPVAIPLGSSVDISPPIPPEEAGSRETPARSGHRLVLNDVAITVNSIERGEKAARAAWDIAPSGYEYILIRLQYENPNRVPIEFDTVLVNDENEGLFPQPLMQGVDFRFEAEADNNGVTTGDILFLARSDELYTLMLHSYDQKYPVVFYALP